MATLANTEIVLLNEYGVSEILGVSVATIRRWRLLRQGPKYIKVGSSVRYKREDVAAWLDSRPTGGGQ
jgi:excisionase family DNA binding protein